MPPYCTIIVALSLCFLFDFSSAIHLHHHRRRTVTPPAFTVAPLGQAADATVPAIHRDGGGGGVLNDKNWIIFSDTQTDKSFASNTYAVVSPSRRILQGETNPPLTLASSPQSEPIDPTNLTDFTVNGAPKLAVPWEPTENSAQDFIWPSTSLTSRSTADTTAYAVYPVGTRCNANGCGKYNTLCKITATDIGLEMERLIPQLFTEGVQPQFGTFSTTYDISTDDLYLISSDGRIAKVPYSSAGNISQYSYWTGGGNYDSSPFHATQLVDSSNTPISGSMCGFSTGDVFFSPRYQTWLIIYMTSCVDSTFYIRYSLTGRIEGPYSDQQTLYKTVVPTAQQQQHSLQPLQGSKPAGASAEEASTTTNDQTKMNYAGHAYPHFLGDRSGKQVLLSWTEQPLGGYQMGMAIVTFS